MKLLVLTSDPLTPEDLRRALPDGVDPAESEVLVVAPALATSPMRFWVSDADEAIARARGVEEETVAALGEAGVAASGDTGEADPMLAVQDALVTFPADRIVVFSGGDAADRYRAEIDEGELHERFGIPVDRV